MRNKTVAPKSIEEMIKYRRHKYGILTKSLLMDMCIRIKKIEKRLDKHGKI